MCLRMVASNGIHFISTLKYWDNLVIPVNLIEKIRVQLTFGESKAQFSFGKKSIVLVFIVRHLFFFYCSIHLVFTTISFVIVSFWANKRAKRMDECSCFIISFHSCQLDSFAIWCSINAIFMVLAFEIQNPSGFFYWPEFCVSNRSYIESTVRSSLNPKRFDDSFHLIRK